MSRREAAGTEILHWYPACRSIWAINPNLNRRVDPVGAPETVWKEKLLSRAAFRQALSLAIDRQTIIDAEYNGVGEPAQVAPGRESPFRHDGVEKAFVAYDPAGANARLDAVWSELGGDARARDAEGFRVYPDGTRMVFYLDYCAFTGIGGAQFVVDDWARVGVRTIPRERDRSLFYQEKAANNFDFNVWTGESDYLPLVEPRYFVATGGESFYAGGWGRWYGLGGFYGLPQAENLGSLAIPVPPESPMHDAMAAYGEALQATTLAEQKRHMDHVLDIAASNTWTIGIATPPPQPVVVKKGFRNVPRNALCGYIFLTPANAGIETYFFEQPKAGHRRAAARAGRAAPSVHRAASADHGAHAAGDLGDRVHDHPAPAGRLPDDA
jgi:ABC-type transport system substrate-binding protein